MTNSLAFVGSFFLISSAAHYLISTVPHYYFNCYYCCSVSPYVYFRCNMHMVSWL